MSARRWLAGLAMALCVVGPATAGAQVLRVGSLRGVPGQFSSVQAAVNAARPGDIVLVGPGDYKTTPSAVSAPAGHPEFPADVLITTPHLLLRGMSRGSVVIDGTGVTTDPWCSGQVFRVPRCAVGRPRTLMNLGVLESFRSVSVRIGKGRTVTHRARGRRAAVRVNLRRYRHRLVRVRYTENIRVGGHREHAVFTRIFHRC